MMEVLISMLLLRGMPLLPSRRREPGFPFLVAEALMPIMPLLIMKNCFRLVEAVPSIELARDELFLMMFLVSPTG